LNAGRCERFWAAACLAALTGCAQREAASDGARAPTGASGEIAVPASTADTASAAKPRQRAAEQYDEPPPGFVEMRVANVVPEGDGATVLLVDEARKVVIPIGISPGQALSIELRLRGREYVRPLTHDLFDNLLRDVGARVVSAQIDGLRDNAFVATLVILHDGRELRLDARASDAIALALGADAPIHVSREVIDQTGLSVDSLGSDPPEPPTPEPGEPEGGI
jgi:bifunctional DNase/RNase